MEQVEGEGEGEDEDKAKRWWNTISVTSWDTIKISVPLGKKMLTPVQKMRCGS